MYHLIRILIRNGDAYMIKLFYKESLPIHLITSKNHYYDIVPFMMDELYDTIGSQTLYLARVNQTSPLYDGDNRNGALMENWSMNSFIKMIQFFYHQMGF